MAKVKYDKDVDVRVDGTVNVQVYCAECGEFLEVTKASSGESYHTSDNIMVEVKPHTCPPEEKTDVTT